MIEKTAKIPALLLPSAMLLIFYQSLTAADNQDKTRYDNPQARHHSFDQAQNKTETDNSVTPTPEQEKRILQRLKENMPKAYQFLLAEKSKNPKYYKQSITRLHQRLKQRRRRHNANNNESNQNTKNNKYQDKRITQNLKESDELKQKMKSLYRLYQNTSREKRDNIIKEIRSLAGEAFDLTTKRRKLILNSSSKRLEQARRKLSLAKQQLEKRQTNRNKHLDTFMQRLQAGEDLRSLIGSSRKK